MARPVEESVTKSGWDEATTGVKINGKNNGNCQQMGDSSGKKSDYKNLNDLQVNMKQHEEGISNKQKEEIGNSNKMKENDNSGIQARAEKTKEKEMETIRWIEGEKGMVTSGQRGSKTTNHLSSENISENGTENRKSLEKREESKGQNLKGKKWTRLEREHIRQDQEQPHDTLTGHKHQIEHEEDSENLKKKLVTEDIKLAQSTEAAGQSCRAQ